MKFEENPLVDDGLDSTTHNVVNHPKSEHVRTQGANLEKLKTHLASVISAPKTKRLLIILSTTLFILLLVVFNWQTLSGVSTNWFKQVSEPDLPTGEVVQPLWVSQVNQLRDQFSEQIQQQRDNLEDQANNLGSAAQSAQLAYQQSEKNAVDMAELESHIGALDEKLSNLSATLSNQNTNTAPSKELTALSQAFEDLQTAMQGLTVALNEEKRTTQSLRAQVANLTQWKSEIERAKQQAEQQAQPSVETNAIPWKLVAASSQGNLAYLEHTGTGAKFRVVQGTDIPHCGKVTRINAEQQQVLTKTCAIKRIIPDHPKG